MRYGGGKGGKYDEEAHAEFAEWIASEFRDSSKKISAHKDSGLTPERVAELAQAEREGGWWYFRAILKRSISR